MKNRFNDSREIKRDVKRNSTCIILSLPLAGGREDFRHINWENYYRDCRERLYKAAKKHGLEVIVWTIDLDESYTSVSHYVTVRSVLYGTLPLRIMRALRPCRAYRALWLLERAIRNNWPVGLAISKAVEAEHLCRFDRNWKRLAEPIPSQLLMRAITETPWKRLISPADKPWAYINIATRRICERQYQTKEEPDSDKGSRKRDYPEAGDELHIADITKPLQAAGVGSNAIAVLMAKAEGRRLSAIQSHRTDGTSRPMSAGQLKAANRKLKNDAEKILASAMAVSTWRPRSSSHLVYRERLPDGQLWSGRSTFAHTLKGKDLEVMRQIMNEERKDLHTLNNLPICPKRKEGCMTIVNRCEDQRQGKEPCRAGALAPQEREARRRPLPKAA